MPRTLSIPFNAGQREKIAAKHAPFGVLKLGKNLRHREQGGLGMRYGYAPVGNGTITGTLVAHDLHEYQGRLLALGSDQLEGYPHDILEFVNLPNQKWRSAQGTGNRYAVSPFTNAREVGNVPQIQGGADHVDAASGGGYVLLVYRSTDNTHTYATIVDARTNQSVYFEDLSNIGIGGLCSFERAAFAGGRFFVMATKLSDNSVKIASFQVGVDSNFQTFATVDGANGALVTAADLVPVSRNSTALLCAAFDRGTSTDLSIKVFQSNGTQLGSTIAVTGTNTTVLQLDADQTDNTILLATVESAASKLRTFNFAGTLLAGPTTIQAVAQGVSVARRTSGVGSDTAFVSSKVSFDTFIQSCAVDNHAGLATFQTLFNASPTSRLFSFTGITPDLVLGAIVGRGNNSTNLTNVLFHVGSSVVHAMSRDYLEAAAPSLALPTSVTLDATTGALCWCSLHQQPGTIGVNKFPTVTLVDYRSTARVQGVTYGGLRYFAGAAPWIYDGRAATEVGFIEPPIIISVTPDSSGGSLTPGAKYTYVAHWEVTYADGSFIESAPSPPVNVTMGVADTENTVAVTGPHTLRTVLGASALGSSVTLVLSRTEWSPTTLDPVSGIPGSQFSVFRRSKEADLSADVTLYGQSTSLVDQTPDSSLGTRGAIYTQADRGEFSGPLEHNAVESCRYITASESRIYTGGLVRPFEVQVSLDAFLGQPYTWSFRSNFYQQVSDAVLAVYSLGGLALVFTKEDIFALLSGLPDDEGKGALGSPRRLSAPAGLKDWRSLVEEPGGLWCQLDDDKLFRIASPGAVPTWAGADIQKTLQAFPTITAAARHKADNVVLFAASNAALTDARIIVRDQLFETWLLDTPPLQSSKGIEALTVFGRQAAYISGGIVYTQTIGSFADGTATFIDLEALTQPIYPFGLGGYGLIHDALITLEYRGDCVLSIRVSYDDGKTFPQTVSWTLLASDGLSAGSTVQKRWALPQDVTSSVVFDITVTTNGAPTEGVVLNELTLLVESESGLKELNPADCA